MIENNLYKSIFNCLNSLINKLMFSFNRIKMMRASILIISKFNKQNKKFFKMINSRLFFKKKVKIFLTNNLKKETSR